MAQPTPYIPATIFLTYSAATPTFPGQQLDAEFTDLKLTTDQLRVNLALIQRDDGALANASVDVAQLTPALAALIGDPTAAALIYAARDAAAASAAAALVSQNTSTTQATTSTTQAAASAASAAAALVSQNSASTSATTATTQAGISTTQASASAASAAAALISATVSSGVPWNFEASVTMAAPASGGIRLNNATIASVTAIAVNALSADAGNPSVRAFVNVFDDSSTTAHRGYIVVRKISAPTNFAIFDITGALTDNVTWLQLAVTYVVGNGSFSAADALGVQFFRTGDAGSGTIAGGTIHGVAIASGAASIGGSVVLTDGQLVVGQTGADPLAKAMTGDATLAASGAIAVSKFGGTTILSAAGHAATDFLLAASNLSDLANAGTARTNLGLGSIATEAEATTAQYLANTAAKALATDKVWGAATEVALTDAATVLVDMSTFINGQVTLAGNRTLGQPSNTKVGQTGRIRIMQDGTGTRTLAYHADWKFAGGTAPVLTTTASARDILYYEVISANVILGNVIKDVK